MEKEDLKEIVILSTIGQYRVACVVSHASMHQDQDLCKDYDLDAIVKIFNGRKVFKTLQEALALASIIKAYFGRIYPISFINIEKKFSDIYATTLPEPITQSSETPDEIPGDMYGIAETSETPVVDFS